VKLTIRGTHPDDTSTLNPAVWHFVVYGLIKKNKMNILNNNLGIGTPFIANRYNKSLSK
jgi:hypothetical protein